jgi:phosphoribosylformylglycinamidine synthase
MDAGLIASCHDCADGGLGIALAETAFAGGFGMAVDLSRVPSSGIDRNDELVFSESQSRFVVTVAPAAREAFEAIMADSETACIGCITGDRTFVVTGLQGAAIIEEDLASLKEAWQQTLRDL